MLLNVRLGPQEEKALRGLRRARVNVSALVRKALRDAEEAQRGGRRTSPVTLLREIIQDFPSGNPVPSGRPDLTDRRAIQAYIRKQLERKQLQRR